MSDKKSEIRKIEKWLFASQQTRPDPKFPPRWRQNLMREVLLLSQPAALRQKVNGFTAAFTRKLFWFAGVSAPFAVALLLIAFFYEPDLKTQMANLAMNYSLNELHLEKMLGY